MARAGPVIAALCVVLYAAWRTATSSEKKRKLSGTPPRRLYQYQPLPLDPRSIRLLRVLPELEHGLIKCELITTGFPKRESGLRSENTNYHPYYNALSYQWGEVTAFGKILLDEEYLNVSQNLFEFLQLYHSKLRSEPTLDEYLWIDAICINQQDVQEKQHQVKQMGDIYRYANNVFMWLGAQISETIDAGAEELLRIDGLPKDTEHGAWSRSGYTRTLDPISAACSAMMEIAQNPYWGRMWIIQEVLLAQSAQIWLGDYVFSWELVKEVFLFDRLREGAHASRLVTAFRHHKFATVINPSICDSVARLSQGHCKEIHDKVYAILGVTLGAEQFAVDYSITPQQLFYAAVTSSYRFKHKTSQETAPTSNPAALWSGRGGHDINALSAADMTREALEVSFSALEEYLADAANEKVRNTVLDIGRPVQTKYDTFTKLQIRLGVGKDFEHPFKEIVLDFYIPEDHQKQPTCKVTCKTESLPVPFIDEFGLVGLTISSLQNGSLVIPFQAYISLLSVIHNVFRFPKFLQALYAQSSGEMTAHNGSAFELEELRWSRPTQERYLQALVAHSVAEPETIALP